MRFTHRHAGGGLYAFHSEMSAKHPDTDEWIKGICYVSMQDGEARWTTKERWRKRFTEVEAREVVDIQQSINRDAETEEVVSTFTFRVEDAGDLRHMLVTSARRANELPRVDGYTVTVLKAMSDMVAKNLHIRDHDFPDLIGDVAAFHAKFGQEYLGKPRLLPDDLHDFRCKFHDEETSEYRDEYPKLLDAIDRKDRRDIINALEMQLDALCDAAWVILGSADLQFGRHLFYAAWRRVVAANMAKVRKDKAKDDAAESGRAPKYDIVKPAGWTAPDHRDLVQDNAIFDELFAPEQSDFLGTNQEPGGYSDTRAV